jgi:hypothetical protein
MNLGNAFLSTISENDVSGNATGILVINDVLSTLGTVSHNIINGNTLTGVSILSAEGGATFQNNVTNGNGQYGISVVGPGPTGSCVTLRLPTIRRWRTEILTCSTALRFAREPGGAATRSSRPTKVAFIEEAG